MVKTIAFMVMLLGATLMTKAADIRGKIIDAKTKEPLTGATVQPEGNAGAGCVSGVDGTFTLKGLQKGRRYTLIVRFVSYKTKEIDGVRAEDHPSRDTLVIEMEPDEQTLGEVKVKGMIRRNTEAAMIEVAKTSPVIVSNISAQEIKKTQDNNASEVIRRVPGVSIIDEKFVMVRGLSQRYNNVWINGGAVPSSEADSRAFSFDIIPSSQIDNLVIVKSPSPEYPADFCGGFIKINTKDIPAANMFAVSLGGNWNDRAHLRSFAFSKGSGTDFLGFDNGLRSLDGGFNVALPAVAGDRTVDPAANGFNTDWKVKNMKPAGDVKLGAEWARRWTPGSVQIGMTGALNYTNEYRTYEKMENNLFGVYDETNDRSNYLRHSVDDQYNNNVRLGAMLNLALLAGNSKFELKNIFNRLATDRYTWREGVSAQSNNEQSAEYYYRSRTTYNVQLTGRHRLGQNNLDWSGSYAYANRRMPDRRRYLVDDALTTGELALTTGNDINREFTRLEEHIVSAAVNGSRELNIGALAPQIKIGAYGEYRTREYLTRQFIYAWNPAANTLPEGFRSMDMTELLSDKTYLGAEGMYMIEEMHKRNDYKGNNKLGAGYLAATLPIGQFSIFAGVRYEFNEMELISNTRDYEVSHRSKFYRDRDFFPSINSTFRINEQHQIRLSYGKSVNRPEFREVSPSVYYDFDLASSVQGNAGLKSCYIHNVDLRYEFYPTKGEQITLAGFYKHFENPIEWTYTVAGGTDLIYSYENAASANNFGVELDIRKDLSFIGLDGLSWSFNGALIHSRVKFDETSRNDNRPMQGQSPYLVNTGFFYRNECHNANVALLYNRIGKRIIGVGRSEGSTGSEDNARIPDSYEMPRNTFDISISKIFGSHIEVKAAVRDLLAESVTYKQFAEVQKPGGGTREVEQITRRYKPGRNISLTVTAKF